MTNTVLRTLPGGRKVIMSYRSEEVYLGSSTPVLMSGWRILVCDNNPIDNVVKTSPFFICYACPRSLARQKEASNDWVDQLR